MKCEHKWQCYGVNTIITDSMHGTIYKYNTIKHFRACILCGKVEELEIKGD